MGCLDLGNLLRVSQRHRARYYLAGMLAQLVPGPLVRIFARPYLAGSTMDDALDTAYAQCKEREVLTTLDLLGEGVVEQSQVEKAEAVYRELIQRVAEDERFGSEQERPTVSLKPSAFTVDDQEAAFEPIYRLAEQAHQLGVAVTVDMEDRAWTDVTLKHAVALYERGWNVGTVLQTRLHRTEADLDLIPEGMRVRLVIGIYPEPEQVALTDKREMKERMLQYAEKLLQRGVKVEFATHDEEYIQRFLKDVAPIKPEHCEVQALLGVPRDKLWAKVKEGELGQTLPIRLYVPFAVDWDDATAYLRRRLDESPNMMWLVLRNLVWRG